MLVQDYSKRCLFQANFSVFDSKCPEDARDLLVDARNMQNHVLHEKLYSQIIYHAVISRISAEKTYFEVDL